MTGLDRYWPAWLYADTGIRDRLLEAYDEPGRWYHNRQHLAEVLARIDLILTAEPSLAVDRDAVLLAAWFHDAVYDSTGDSSGDNEERSAVLAARELTRAGAPGTVVAEVARLVRVTATHQIAADDLNGKVLCDADLGILAADDQRYAEYTQAVRREYEHVPDQDFRSARARILRHLLAAPSLFHTHYAAQHWESAARTNVERELIDLEA